MEENDRRGWHCDSTEFVISLAIAASTGGGLFECAPGIRDEANENYAARSSESC